MLLERTMRAASLSQLAWQGLCEEHSRKIDQHMQRAKVKDNSWSWNISAKTHLLGGFVCALPLPEPCLPQGWSGCPPLSFEAPVSWEPPSVSCPWSCYQREAHMAASIPRSKPDRGQDGSQGDLEKEVTPPVFVPLYSLAGSHQSSSYSTGGDYKRSWNQEGGSWVGILKAACH